MAEIKWIKITTDMFGDEKIDYISNLPDGDTIILIWVRLLLLAGKANSSGWLMLTENIPYDDTMIANKFRKPINTVRFALETFRRLGMIEHNDAIVITNWEKHQNIDGLERIREQNRLRKQKERAKNALLQLQQPCHVTVTNESQTFHALEGEEELDKDYSPTPSISNQISEMTVMDVHAKAFGTIMMSGVMSDFIISLVKEKVSENFIKEAMLEASESSIKPNFKYFKSIVTSWRNRGISSRAEAKADLDKQRQSGGEGNAKSEGGSKKPRHGQNQGASSAAPRESKVSRSRWDEDETV